MNTSPHRTHRTDNMKNRQALRRVAGSHVNCAKINKKIVEKNLKSLT